MPIVNFHITGSAEHLQITLTARDNSHGALLPGTKQYKCPLPPLSSRLQQKDRQWKQKYAAWLSGIATLTPSSPPIEIETNVSILQECQQLGNELIREFNEWIGHAAKIQNALLHTVSSRDYCQNPSDFCFILNVDTIDPALNLTLQRLPFHAWDFFQEYYPHAEISLSTTSHALSAVISQRLQVLVVRGYDPNINLDEQQIAIGKQLEDTNLADVIYWDRGAEENATASLFRTLKNSSPQVLFFIGHSESTNGAIQISINQTEHINLQKDRNFKNILRGLKSRGLIFAAFISCDGLGIAQELSDLGIPYLMVSREILPVHVAREFLNEFLTKAIEPGVPIHIALSHARQHLHEIVEAYKNNDGCPNASTFPVIFQSPEQHAYILNPITKSSPISITPEFRLQFLLDRIIKHWKIASIFSASLILVMIIALIRKTELTENACDSTIKNLSYLSCGEKSILGNEYLDLDAKKGMAELKLYTPNYLKAIESLEKSWKSNQKNPEVLIALSNAKIKFAQAQAIATGKSSPQVKTIAVVIPASLKANEETYLPISLIAAVAEAQRRWNDRNTPSWLLEVMIANDFNEPEQAKQVVEDLTARPILGTIGHYSSYVTESVLPIYEAKKMTLISATSTAIDLGKNYQFFFRTVNENSNQVRQIIEYCQQRNIKKVELLHGIRNFSSTFKENLSHQAQQNDIEINLRQLTNRKLNASKVLKDLKNNRSQLIVLAPDAFIDRVDQENVRQLIVTNAGKIPIIGNEVVHEPWLFTQIEQQPELGENLMFTFTWNKAVNRTNISPEIYSRSPKWWSDGNRQISHRTVLTYDAANVLIDSIDLVNTDLPDLNIRAMLPRFIRRTNYTGITGKISFNGSNRNENLSGLVQPQFDQSGKLIKFTPPK